MKLPIYASNEHRDWYSKTHSNKGLIFERFFDQYQLKKLPNGIAPEEDGKKKFLESLQGYCGNEKQLYCHVMRHIDLAESRKGCWKVYTLDSHFVTGMGNSHPVENGFLWHYTLGVPYIPGSQVKGMVRGLIEQYFDGQEKEKKDLLHQWFGSDDKDPKQCDSDSIAGEVIFFDAIPMERPCLGVDTMTPHMGKWYAEGGQIKSGGNDSDRIPADWHDPIVIPFLAVRTSSFLFSAAPRAGSTIDMDDVFDCLDKALTYLGAGAKTQTGYGYMSLDKEGRQEKIRNQIQTKKNQLQKAMTEQEEHERFLRSLETRSESARKFLLEQKEYEWKCKEKGTFLNLRQAQEQSDAQRWLAILEENPEQETIELFKEQLELLAPGIYANPDKKKGKKQKSVYKEKAVEAVKRLQQIEKQM